MYSVFRLAARRTGLFTEAPKLVRAGERKTLLG
jgi:hypothetical protein